MHYLLWKIFAFRLSSLFIKIRELFRNTKTVKTVEKISSKMWERLRWGAVRSAGLRQWWPCCSCRSRRARRRWSPSSRCRSCCAAFPCRTTRCQTEHSRARWRKIRSLKNKQIHSFIHTLECYRWITINTQNDFINSW